MHHERRLAVIEVADPDEEHPLPGEVRWVHRNGSGFGAGLAEALRAVELPEGPGQVWGAAESRVARDVRDILRGERELPRKHVKATGYWLRAGDWILDED
jgi:NADPH-dependent ferric siderophore reductase